MKRLTKKDIENIISHSQTMFIQGRNLGKTLSCQLLSEMLEYKTIEEKLPIDLPTYFKYLEAIKVYTKEDTGGNIEEERYIINEHYVVGCTSNSVILLPVACPYGECELTRKFTDYGKEWALTREELL